MHKSVGAIIKNENGDILMIDRKKKPFGWACPAGHIDDGETPEQAVAREVTEETGLLISELELTHHEFVAWNTCSHDVVGHDWYIFNVPKYTGEVNIETEEVKSYEWVEQGQLDYVKLEKVWQLWHEKKLLK